MRFSVLFLSMIANATLEAALDLIKSSHGLSFSQLVANALELSHSQEVLVALRNAYSNMENSGTDDAFLKIHNFVSQSLKFQDDRTDHNLLDTFIQLKDEPIVFELFANHFLKLYQGSDPEINDGVLQYMKDENNAVLEKEKINGYVKSNYDYLLALRNMVALGIKLPSLNVYLKLNEFDDFSLKLFNLEIDKVTIQLEKVEAKTLVELIASKEFNDAGLADHHQRFMYGFLLDVLEKRVGTTFALPEGLEDSFEPTPIIHSYPQFANNYYYALRFIHVTSKLFESKKDARILVNLCRGLKTAEINRKNYIFNINPYHFRDLERLSWNEKQIYANYEPKVEAFKKIDPLDGLKLKVIEYLINFKFQPFNQQETNALKQNFDYLFETDWAGDKKKVLKRFSADYLKNGSEVERVGDLVDLTNVYLDYSDHTWLEEYLVGTFKTLFS